MSFRPQNKSTSPIFRKSLEILQLSTRGRCTISYWTEKKYCLCLNNRFFASDTWWMKNYYVFSLNNLIIFVAFFDNGFHNAIMIMGKIFWCCVAQCLFIGISWFIFRYSFFGIQFSENACLVRATHQLRLSLSVSWRLMRWLFPFL